jgi:hypothetical protein
MAPGLRASCPLTPPAEPSLRSQSPWPLSSYRHSNTLSVGAFTLFRPWGTKGL